MNWVAVHLDDVKAAAVLILSLLAAIATIFYLMEWVVTPKYPQSWGPRHKIAFRFGEAIFRADNHALVRSIQSASTVGQPIFVWRECKQPDFFGSPLPHFASVWLLVYLRAPEVDRHELERRAPIDYRLGSGSGFARCETHGLLAKLLRSHMSVRYLKTGLPCLSSSRSLYSICPALPLAAQRPFDVSAS
jgi:hypothetical protein